MRGILEEKGVSDSPAPISDLKFETAAEHYTRNVPIANPADMAGRVREALIGNHFDSVAEIVVCDSGGRLVGLVNIENLLVADAKVPLLAIMDPSPPAVTAAVDQELAAWKAIRHAESSLAVVDHEGRFQGIITPRRIFEVLLLEHDEDTARFSGVLHGTSEAHNASTEPVLRRLGHRIPWLLLGLFGAFLSAELIGLFEAQLQAQILLAFFVPGIVYLADAVGTQTETLAIRGLSVGVKIESVFWREVVTGALIGVLLGAIAFPAVYWRWGDVHVALAVALAIVAACSVASSLAMALPWILKILRQDPAFAAGPLATVLQDLLSVLIYLLICFLLRRD
jgi:magnesium transporter